MKSLCILAVLLGVSHLLGCGTRGPARVHTPTETIEADDPDEDVDDYYQDEDDGLNYSAVEDMTERMW